MLNKIKQLTLVTASLVLILLRVDHLSAAPNWVGSSSADLTDPTNWTPAVVPANAFFSIPTAVIQSPQITPGSLATSLTFTSMEFDNGPFTVIVDNQDSAFNVSLTTSVFVNTSSTQVFNIINGGKIFFPAGASADQGSSGFVQYNVGSDSPTFTSIMQLTNATAGKAAITLNPGVSTQVTNLNFLGSSDAQQCTIIAQSTSNVNFSGSSNLNQASISLLNSNISFNTSTTTSAATVILSNTSTATAFQNISLNRIVSDNSSTINLPNTNLTILAPNSNDTIAGFIGGVAGSLTKKGPNTLILTNTNTYNGLTTVTNGSLQIDTGTLNPAGGILVSNPGNIIFSHTIATAGTYSGVISGSGSVTITGGTVAQPSTVNFTGINSYSNGTTIQANNTLYGTLASIQGNITNSGNVDFESSGSYMNQISGTGNTLINNFGGTGTVTFTSAQPYIGATTITAGTLALINTGNISSSSGLKIGNTATFDISSITPATSSTIGDLSGGGFINLGAINLITGTATTSTTYSGIISGTGGVTKQGAGLLVLTGLNTYSGNTHVTAGTLQFIPTFSYTFPSHFVVDAATTLDLDQGPSTTGTYSGGIAGSGNLNINQSGSTGDVFLTGPSTFSGPTIVNAGTLAGFVNTLPTVLPIQVKTNATLDLEQPAASSGIFTGTIQDFTGQHGAVAINKLGNTGTIVLSGLDTYTGGTTVYNGTLQGTVTTLLNSIAVNSHATVDIEQPTSTTGIFTGTISDNGASQHGAVAINQQNGATGGTVVFNSPQTYTGGTSIFGGTLRTQPGFLSGNVAISSGAFFDLEQPSSSATFTGNISGNGAVLINSIGGDTGTVILSGVNSYTGGTFVNGGTLQGNTNSLFGSITDNANVNFVQPFNGVFNGSFLGSGNINITGPGLVVFNTGSPLFSGTTNIVNGSLSLNTILGGNVNVQALGTLLGNATILGNLTIGNQGFVIPNSSTTVITIGANFHQLSGSTYETQIDVGSNSIINISGHATLDPGSALLIDLVNGVPFINHVYTILSATGGLSGTYTSTELEDFQNALLVPTVFYDGQHVYVQFGVNFAVIALTYNQMQVARQLATITDTSDPALNAILHELVSLTPLEAQNSLSQMSAEQYTNVILTSELAGRQFIRRLYDPLRTIITTNPCNRAVCCNYIQDFDTWASISGGRTFIHGNENARGFRISDYEICGGVQTTLRQNWTVGVALSYERDTLGYRVGGSGRCNTVLSGIYGLYRSKRFYLVADAVFGYSNNKVKRTINIGNLHYAPRGNPKIYQAAMYAELGTDFAIRETLIQPFIGIEWGHFRYNRFNESCGSPLDVTVFQKSKINAYSRLGMHVTTPPLRCGFSMGIDLAWVYRLTSLQNNISMQFQSFGSTTNILGLPLNRNSYEGTVYFNQSITRNWKAFFEATCRGWTNSTAYSFVGGLQATW